MSTNGEFGKLSAAAENGGVEDVSYVLKHTKDLGILKDDMQRALVIAAARNYTDIGAELIMYGADVNYGACRTYNPNTKDANGRPPIFNAVESAAYEFIELLLSHGADLNIFEDRGYTPLVAAYYYCEPCRGNDTVFGLLMEGGADPFLGWRDGTSFADLYKDRENMRHSLGTDAINLKHSCTHENTGFELFAICGKVGIKKDDVIIVPAYFTTVNYSMLPYATYFTYKSDYSNHEFEVILLHQDIRRDAEKMFEISDCYSSCAELWLYDEMKHFTVIERLQDAMPEGTARVFKNGMYYLFDQKSLKIISRGFSYIYPGNDKNVF